MVGVEVFGEDEVKYLQQNLKPAPVEPALAAIDPSLAAHYGQAGGSGAGGHGYGYGYGRRGGRGGRGRPALRS